MATVTIPDYERGATFEEVRAILQDIALQQKENDRRHEENAKRQEENNRWHEEAKKQAEREIQEIRQLMNENAEGFKELRERWKKAEAQFKKTDEQMGGLHNRFGELAEHLVAPGIEERFNELGYHFTAKAVHGYKILGDDKKVKAEIDLLMENHDTIMAVEVKATVKVKDIKVHIKRLEILRDYRREYHDPRQVEGAIAGAIFGEEEKQAALEAGFYVIVQTGDTMKIEIPDGFVPRRW